MQSPQHMFWESQYKENFPPSLNLPEYEIRNHLQQIQDDPPPKIDGFLDTPMVKVYGTVPKRWVNTGLI